MNAAEIRAKAFKKELKLTPIADLRDIFPEWVDPVLDESGNPVMESVPVLDADGKPVIDANGQPTSKSRVKVKDLVQLREITGAESQVVLADAKSMAPKLLALSIITTDTKEQVFALTDIGTIMDTLGMTAIVPILNQSMMLSGLSANEATTAKNA